MAGGERYARQLGIPGIGESGQARLARASVFVLGAGGLGGPVLTYLGAAGVGEIAFVDRDVIELSNLNRQCLYNAAEIGESKAAVAARRLTSFNPEVRWRGHGEPLTPELARACLAGRDLALDCADNYATRRLLAAAAHAAGVPVIHGAVAAFEGTLGIFDSRTGPCFACVTPEPPGKPSPPPVLGAVAGALGCMMAGEAIRLICGVGPDRRGQVLLADLERGAFDWVRAVKMPACPVCGG